MKSTSVCTALLAAVGIAACFPDDLTSVDELDTVTTVFKQDADFGALQRYTIADSVLHLPDEGSISRSSDQALLSSIRENLNAAGYTEETDPAANPPDVVVLVAISTADNVAYTTYDFWGYWGWYPYWDPLYSAGYGWGYPAGTVAYSYQTGTVLVTLVRDHPTDVQSQKVPVLWAAAINGVLEGSSDVQRALDGIDKAFAQSPYLRAQ
jgi:hypothetical protein